MKLGFLYAGQGSQHAGMGADLYEAFSAFRAVYDHAEVDFDLKKVTFEDPDGKMCIRDRPWPLSTPPRTACP